MNISFDTIVKIIEMLIPSSFPQLSNTGLYYIGFVFVVFLMISAFKMHLRPVVLLIANVIFLYSFGIYHLVFVSLISIIYYFVGLFLKNKNNTVLSYLSTIPLVIIMVVFKYQGFFDFDNLVAPLGLSFYSFKILSYVFDVSNGKMDAEKNIIYYLDYVMFFPTITAGPINRSKEFLEEIKIKRDFNYIEAKNGAVLMFLGIFEKLVFCEFIVSLIQRSLDNPELSGWNTIFGVVLYSFQIYLDFDSYSNIAIGTAQILGFKITRNFHTPYLAKNLNDFWRRWHISLSSWFRDYLYIPLGGNRKGTIRKYLNLMIVFLVSGVWHGNTFNFVLWGFLHALIQIIENLLRKPFKNMKTNIVFDLFGILLNFVIVTILWLVFRYSDLTQVSDIITRCLTLEPFDIELIGMTINELYWLYVVLVTIIITDLLRNKCNMVEWLSKRNFMIRWSFYLILIVVFLIFGSYGSGYNPSDFIYRDF